MKEVMAVIRINMMNRTKKALGEAGISSFTATGGVHGRGKGDVDLKVMDGARQGYVEALSQLGREPRLIAKRSLTVIVPDNLVKKVVNTIMQVNRTGKPGDGKIFIMPVLEATRVRTGESGESVLDT
ncbi:P-II family nitrogen regulator [bacterium]|nr:P-II family nitrogen regulator [bacterium]